jgi:hypothetical protein
MAGLRAGHRASARRMTQRRRQSLPLRQQHSVLAKPSHDRPHKFSGAHRPAYFGALHSLTKPVIPFKIASLIPGMLP